MISQTGITPLDAWLKLNNKTVTKVEATDFEELRTNLAQDKTNSLINESAGADQLLVIWGWSITAGEALNIVAKANNDQIYSGTDKLHPFSEPVIIDPQRSFELTESHSNRTIPIRVSVPATRYWLS